MTTGFDLDEIERLLAAATVGDLTTAQYHTLSEYVECPVCDGDGEVRASDYCNFDGVALGVQFYGIGSEFGAHERLWTELKHSAPAMIAAIRELRAENARLAGLSKHNNELARMRHAQANDFRAKYVSVTGDPS